MNRPSSAPSRLLRRLGIAVGIALAGVAVVAALAALAVASAFLGGPVLVDILGR